eukprot:2205499-Rhodomonas_salina.2
MHALGQLGSDQRFLTCPASAQRHLHAKVDCLWPPRPEVVSCHSTLGVVHGQTSPLRLVEGIETV